MARTVIRPGWVIRKISNPIVRRLGLASTLVVRGRRSGREYSIPVNVLTHEGKRYLMSPRGETDWVLNLRASGTGELRTRKRRERFTAVEVTGDERAAAVAAYLAKWGRTVKAFFAELPDPEDHPTFVITSSD